jgi:hypothetical protein
LKYLHLAIRQGFDADTQGARFFVQGSLHHSGSAVTSNCGWHSAILLCTTGMLSALPHTIMSG